MRRHLTEDRINALIGGISVGIGLALGVVAIIVVVLGMAAFWERVG